MNENHKPTSRPQRRRSFAPDVALAVLTGTVIAVIALVVYANPLPHAHSFMAPAKAVQAVPAPSSSGEVLSAEQSVTVPVADAPVDVTPPASLPPGSVFIPNPKLPLTITRVVDGGIKIVLVEGGTLGTRRSPIRQGVQDFVRQAGASAGVNGTFFANASLTGTDNLLIGPSLCDNESVETLSPFDTKPQLEGRPLVIVSPSSTCIVPYDIASLSGPGAIQSLLPDVTDAFLGGVWLVHDGSASTRSQLASYNVHDAEDPRRRAFFGIMPDGRPVLGATDGSTTSLLLGRALAASGIREAVLLDSGFSTSLVFQQTVLVTGHSTPNTPSRPVPHALVLFGQPDPSALAQIGQTPPTS